MHAQPYTDWDGEAVCADTSGDSGTYARKTEGSGERGSVRKSKWPAVLVASTCTLHCDDVRSAHMPSHSEDGEDLIIEDDADDGGGNALTHAWKFLLSGGIAGAVSRTATAPFDRVKLYLITRADGVGTPQWSSKGSINHAVLHVYKTGGIKSFWTGNGLNIIKIFPESAIKFLSYEFAKRCFAQYWDCVEDQSLISNSSRFISGGIGGVISQCVIYPIETLKTRVMSSTDSALKGNALIRKTARDLYAHGTFFKGLSAGLVGVFPYSAIDLSTFELLKMTYTSYFFQDPTIGASLCFGAVSGGIGATSVYPLNLVRTRVQAQGTSGHPFTYNGVLDAALKCYQREGWLGFYKGLTPNLVKVIPAVAISQTVYDFSKRFLIEPTPVRQCQKE